MIGTIEIKRDQLTNGYFTIGSGNELIFIMGSCRAVPYLNYFNEWNKTQNRFTLVFLDPFNWNWDLQDNRTDYNKILLELEKNENILAMLRSCTIFIHEFYANAGMFNVYNKEKNIYQFGLKPKIDICLPNYNDVFVLTREIVSFDTFIRTLAIQDYNVIGKLSTQTLELINDVRNKNLEKFYDICSKTSFPEFAETFKNNYKKKRYFWTFNHIAKEFTLTIFKLLNDKFLKLYLSDFYQDSISKHDMYANNFTYLSEYDLGYEWNEEVKPLKQIL